MSSQALAPAGRSPRAERARFAGVPLDLLGVSEAVDSLLALLDSPVSHQVATVNVDFLCRAQADPWLRAILNRTTLNLVDGTPLVWIVRRLGHELKERAAGSDVVPMLLDRLQDTGHRVYILGGAPDIALAAARLIRQQHPRLQLVGVDSPPVSPVETIDPDAVARIRAAKPHLLLVAFGNPKQEHWLDLHLAETGAAVGIGVGGILDFVARRRRRAPTWMRQAGLEWAARLAQDPFRLGPRYARDAVGISRLLVRDLPQGQDAV